MKEMMKMRTEMNEVEKRGVKTKGCSVKIIKLSAGDIDLKRERERNHKYAM